VVSKTDIVIITPTLGDRATLGQTVASVSEIGGERVRHVLICPRARQGILQDRFPGCEVIVEPEKSGVFGAVNFGLKSALRDCRFCGYINDDDQWLPDFKELLEALDRSEEIAVAYGRVLFVDSNGSPIFESTSSPRYRKFKYLLCRGVVTIAQQATLVRRDVFESLGGFDCSYSLIADSDFWLRAIDAGFKMAYVDRVCATFMLQQGQLSSNRKLVEIELDRLLRQHSVAKDWNAFYEFARFRLENIPIYLRRLINGQFTRVTSRMTNE
jgi:GT2 family glycosyltransferase